MLPSIKNLQYLITLRETLHFSKASEKCFVSQSTLSAGIAKLEQILQTTLVERNNKKVVFTSIGEKIVLQAMLVISNTKELTDMAKTNFLESEIVVGTIPTISAYILPNFLRNIEKIFPKLKISFVEDTSDNLLEKLNQNKIDFAIFAFPYDLPDGVEGYELFRDPLCLIQHKDRKNEKIDSGDLLLLEQGHCLRAHVMQGYAISEKQLSSFSCSSVSTLVAMIDMNLGMSFLPKIAIDFGVLSPYPNIIAKSNCQASRGIGIVYRKNNYQAENIKKIAENLRT
ncbi:hypothetical protein SP60_00950 [Candidatus Thioglobus autotrophicus]|uniref:HTH lysR-type domain-containing protein n=1 Tax=Candidatus Thioglobus autotrophicus TaxID=1705394 RepID=A0A0M4NHU3_9GAMM|nr:LysR substrate-binding domain-containing protein [Candidatus Thioglobus autotrophicus]ALE51938.1 hypothetical protein SP60_00950 [Candidatus Thioglobus autotrophicus]WPE17474.1 LysR substrate-binding domain-containing protein [Candidatus Thioglobus autotrophicus]